MIQSRQASAPMFHTFSLGTQMTSARLPRWPAQISRLAVSTNTHPLLFLPGHTTAASHRCCRSGESEPCWSCILDGRRIRSRNVSSVLPHGCKSPSTPELLRRCLDHIDRLYMAVTSSVGCGIQLRLAHLHRQSPALSMKSVLSQQSAPLAPHPRTTADFR